jgi:hypothetical protein
MLEDKTCKELAEYLGEGLNRRYSWYLTKTGQQETHLKRVVKSIRTYDALTVPLEQFPLLKVYRFSDSYRPQTTHSLANLLINYNLSFPMLEELPGLLKFVADNLVYLFLEYSYTRRNQFPLDNTQGLVAEYRLMSNDIIREVHPYLQFRCQVNDMCTVLKAPPYTPDPPQV